MSFGQQSAAKRKREHHSDAGSERRDVKVLRLENALSTDGSDYKCILSSFGQFLLQKDSNQPTEFVANVVSPVSVAPVSLNKSLNLYGTVELGVGPSDTSDIVSCTHDGTIILVNIAQNGTQISLSHKLHFKSEDEYITSICHAGNVLVLGTSNEDLYLIRRYGRTLNADLLQRDRSLFTNLLSSGARFIGIAPVVQADARVVKLIPVPMSYLLLSLTSNSLTLWADWTNPGSEQVVWESELKDMIAEDVGKLGQTGKIDFVDACLMQVEPGAERATMLVLSACYSDNTGSSSTTTASLWMHTLEVQIPSHKSDVEGPSTVIFLHRILVTETARYRPFCSEPIEAHAYYLAPRLASLPPSWRVYVAWSSLRTSDSSAIDANGPTRTLHAVQIDVLNQPLFNANVGTGSTEQKARMLRDSVRCTHAVDSGIGENSVLAVAAVTGVEGLCVMLSDGQIVSFAPRLPIRSSMAFPVVSSTVRDRHLPVRAIARSADAADLLSRAALGEIPASEVNQRVLDCFALCSSAEITEGITEASVKLLSRAPTGEYWGGAGLDHRTAASASASAGAGGSVRSGALTQYQLVHRAVENKLNAHKALIDLVSISGTGGLEAVQKTLLKHHQQILLCAGLSGAAEESQHRISGMSGMSGSSDSAAPAGSFTAVDATQEALRIVGTGMERAVVMGRKLSVESIEAQGLSVADIFYAEAKYVYDDFRSIADCLEDSQARLSVAGKGVQYAVNLHVASMLLSALQLAAVGDGSDGVETSASSQAEIREVMATLLRLLLTAAEAQHSHSSFSSTVAHVRADVAVDKDGKRIKELCYTALQSYAFEASQVSEGVEGMPVSWRAAYHKLKSCCSNLLLVTGHTHTAFALCSEHLYCEGLMESTYRDPGTLLGRLEDTLRRAGHQKSTDAIPLAIGCFQWLEEHNKPADILSLGLTTLPQLEFFLQTRPHLAWMHHLRSGNYHATTVTAAETANSVPLISTATTLLSIAKLSAKLATEGDNSEIARSLFSDATSQKQKKKAACSEQFDSAVHSLNADLAVLQAQKLLIEILPNVGLHPDARANVSDLIKTVIAALRYNGQCSVNITRSDSDHPMHPSDPASLAKCFGVGLSLLSMQLDVLDGLSSAAEDAGMRTAGAEQTHATANSELDRELSSNSTQQQRTADLERQRHALSALITELWAALISANLAVWMDLSCNSSLGSVEENTMKTECWLYENLSMALSEAQSNNLRSELIVTNNPSQSQSVEGVSRLSEKSLLDKAIDSSGIATQQLDPVSGEIRTLPTGQVNARVVHVVKACVELAASEGRIMQ